MSTGEEDPSSGTEPLTTGSIQAQKAAYAPRQRVYLLVTHRDGVATIPLKPGASVVIGRDRPADVVISERGLSRQHARFTLVAAEEVAVEDLGSTNGTRVRRQRVERATIRPGDEVMLGPIAASIHLLASDELRPPGLEGHEGFRAAVEAELERARFWGRPLGVILVRALDHNGERLVVWAPRVRKLLRPIDRAALYGADVMEILLLEAGREQALGMGRAIAALRSGGTSLGCGVAFFPGVGSAEELLEVALAAARCARADQSVQAAASEGHRTIGAGHEAKEGGPVMESPAMREIVRTTARLATAVIPVIIQGETGTGKEVLARLIHEGGPRRDKPLISVNCGAIPADLLESTLFGHERGAFTGASQQQKGLFEAADGGTLFLDEIGELPAAAQAALLRALEEKRVRRVGSTREIEIDVRVIAATHRDLEAMAEAGSFRSDLLYRLNAMVVSLPPLRARRPDIAPLAARFLEKAAKENGREVRGIAADAMALLERYASPGNVRELRNAIERAVVVAEGETVTPLDLPARVRAAGEEAASMPARAARDTGSLESRVSQFERDTILEALREANNQKSEAARLLEVPLRTLERKISALGLGEPQGPSSAAPGEFGPAAIQASLDEHNGSIEDTWRTLGLSSRHALTRLIRKHGLVIRKKPAS